MYEGVINKAVLGSSHNSLILIFNKEYSDKTAVNFINNVQFIAYEWLLHFGFSVGIKDCIATKSNQIDHVVSKCFIEAQGVEETTTNPLIREVKVAASLSRARDNGMRIAKEALGSNNNLYQLLHLVLKEITLILLKLLDYLVSKIFLAQNSKNNIR